MKVQQTRSPREKKTLKSISRQQRERERGREKEIRKRSRDQDLPPYSPPPLPLGPKQPPPPLLPSQQQLRILFSFPKRPALRVTSEYDKDSSVFLQKVSCKLLDGLAKLKLSFRNDRKGEVAEPRLAFISKHLSLHYDVEKAKEPGIVLSVVEEEPNLQ